ncbi:hypothetical protein [Tellurirhabdus bombi]|uniref:hypothetical protein n=1 Tax=Tellurirhabdus bombi TaxID=2907205 RepID=UPI001F3C113B|nr:hypothetical protein [Tellurirhabdus bombi]
MYPVSSLTPLTTELADDVLSKDRVMGWLRISGEAEVKDIEDLILGAMQWAEKYCNQPLFARAATARLDRFEGGEFNGFYVASVDKVEFRLTGQTALHTLDATEYEAEILPEAAFLRFFQATAARTDIDRVIIHYTAGLTPPPQSILYALRLWIAYMYDNRADSKKAAPSAAEVLLDHYRKPSTSL